MATRERNAPQTRARILAAARLQFGSDGFDRTTIRSVAAAAEVDPALVMHYFRNKDGLFAAAAAMDIALPDLTAVPADQVADVLLPHFVAAWRPDGPFLTLLRAATSHPVAAEALVQVFTEQVAPGLGAASVDRPAQRAALIGAHLIGIAVSRHILRTPPLVEMDDEELIQWLRPAIAHYLTAPR